MKDKKDTCFIVPIKNGPYLVYNASDLENSRGEKLKVKPVMTLCRCGKSKSKPFCDGAHVKIDFKTAKDPNRVPDRLDKYEGQNITIFDNRGVCAHSGYCTDNSPKVFDRSREPWIDPDADNADKTAETIRMCPSGALSYLKDGELYKDQDRTPKITVSKNGPYRIVGYIELRDPDGNEPESKEHYTLCRCGFSKNKPFCSGAHWDINFNDPDN